MRMKRWESPRREGRNDKGRKSSARQRQIKKQTQMLRRKLKGNPENEKRDSSWVSFLMQFNSTGMKNVVEVHSKACNASSQYVH